MGCELGEGLNPQPLLYLEPPGEGALFLSLRCPLHPPNPTIHAFHVHSVPFGHTGGKTDRQFQRWTKNSILCCRFFCT